MSETTAEKEGVIAQQDSGWQPFDYKAPPEEGVYWLAVERPETWCDAGDDGRDIGGYTGGTTRVVCLALVYEVQNELGEWEVRFDAIRGADFPEVEADDGVVSFMPLRAPALPKAP